MPVRKFCGEGIAFKFFPLLKVLRFVPNPPIRRVFRIIPTLRLDGASDGNRTHVTSLGSWYSTIELRSPISFIAFILRPPKAD